MRLSAIRVVLIFSACCASAAPDVVPPDCEKPAPLEGQWHKETPGYLVAINRGWLPARLRVAVLEWKYNFRADGVYRSGRGFFVSGMQPTSLAALRCDAAIRYIEFNRPVQLLGEESPNKTMEPTR